jgi:hypothetical protein
VGEGANLGRLAGLVEGVEALGQALGGIVGGAIGGMVGRQGASESFGKRGQDQVDRVAEVAAGEVGVVVVVEGDSAQGDVDPEVVAAAFEGEAEDLAGLVGLAGAEDFLGLLEVVASLLDAAGVDELEDPRGDGPDRQAAAETPARIGAGAGPAAGAEAGAALGSGRSWFAVSVPHGVRPPPSGRVRFRRRRSIIT